MKKLIALVALTVLFASTAAMAYDGITFYGANLSAHDRVSSTGVALTSVPAILQQDRANYYKFNKRDPQDQPDGFFTTVNKRLLFQNATIKIDPSLKKKILNGTVGLVAVWVYDDHTMEVTEGLPAQGAD
jgi:hypothetical protein